VTEERVHRRIVAILAADVVGYSRLIGEDEAGTRARFNDQLEKIVNPALGEHRGRLVKTMGDGFLVEFGSVVEALQCAMDIQGGIAERQAGIPDPQKILFRMGIHLGDVIVEGEDIHGDGVNIASRLESLAAPAGICVSSMVYEGVRGKLEVAFSDLGDHALKNIAAPVRVYRVLPDGTGATAPHSQPPKWRRMAVAALLLVAVAGGAVGWWWMRAAVPPTAAPPNAAVTRSEKASIAVLPFVNISGDKAQEYFSDGMTEDLITDLSKISGLSVIARTSTAGYKGRKIDIREIGKTLDVRYVLEGSVRKAGGSVRINAQLIDAATGGHLWAERYDGSLNDIFRLQDRVLEKIVASLTLKLSGTERQRIAMKGTQSVAAHDLYLQGVFEESRFSRQGGEKAIRLYEQALSIDPNYPLPYAHISNILQLNTRNGWSDDIERDLKKAVELAERAVALDSQNPRLHWSLGRAVARLRTPKALKQGIKSMERAIELDPDFADAKAFLAVLYVGDGRAEDGFRSVEAAMRLNPRYPFWYLFLRGITQFVVEDYDSAIADFEAAAQRSPTALFLRWWLAASYAQVGRQADAEWQVEELKTMGFKGDIKTLIETQPILHRPYLAIYKRALRKAGIPE